MESCHNVVTNLLWVHLKSSVASHQTWHRPICLNDCHTDCPRGSAYIFETWFHLITYYTIGGKKMRRSIIILSCPSGCLPWDEFAPNGHLNIILTLHSILFPENQEAWDNCSSIVSRRKNDRIIVMCVKLSLRGRKHWSKMDDFDGQYQIISIPERRYTFLWEG